MSWGYKLKLNSKNRPKYRNKKKPKLKKRLIRSQNTVNQRNTELSKDISPYLETPKLSWLMENSAYQFFLHTLNSAKWIWLIIQTKNKKSELMLDNYLRPLFHGIININILMTPMNSSANLRKIKPWESQNKPKSKKSLRESLWKRLLKLLY